MVLLLLTLVLTFARTGFVVIIMILIYKVYRKWTVPTLAIAAVLVPPFLLNIAIDIQQYDLSIIQRLGSPLKV